MEFETKMLNVIIISFLFLIPLMWLFNLNEIKILNEVLNYLIIIVSLYTPILAIRKCKLEKKSSTYIFFIIFTLSTVLTLLSFSKGITSTIAANYLSIMILPISLVIFDDLIISDRALGILLLIIGGLSFFKIENTVILKEIIYLSIPLLIVLINNEKNIIIRIIYIVITLKFPFIIMNKLYYILLIYFLELISFANYKIKYNNKNYIYLYAIYAYFFATQLISLNLPIIIVIVAISAKGLLREKNMILIATNNKKEISLINFINNISKNDFIVKIKNNNNNKLYLIYTSIFYYNTYICTCSYDIDSKMTFLVSSNNLLYVNDKNIIIKNKDKYNKIIFKTNEIKEYIIKKYSIDHNKCLVINNFIDIDYVESGRLEKIKIKKSSKCLIVCYGNITINQLTIMINLAKTNKDIEIWILNNKQVNYTTIIEKNRISSKIKLITDYINPYPYIARANYVIISSKYGEYPNIFIESLLLSKNIITQNDSSDEISNLSYYSFVIKKDNQLEDIRKIVNLKMTKKDIIDNINVYKIQKERKNKWERLFKGGI